MESSDLSRNLKLLIAYSESISEVCKKIKISRQQFTKYLSGKSFPRLQSLQRICDHFGLEDWEILLPHSDFRKLITIKTPFGVSDHPSFSNKFLAEIRKKSLSSRSLAPFLGFYYNHFVLKAKQSMIQRSLVYLFEVDGMVATKTIERTANTDNVMSVSKYDGIAYYSGHRLYISEREKFLGQTIWHTTLYATTTKREQFFSGLGLGSTTDSVQDISCYRSIFQFLGRTISLREALNGCGLFDLDDTEIPIYIRDHIENRIETGDNAFVAA